MDYSKLKESQEYPLGWDDLVINLVKELHALDENLHIGQIKEKFGGLRAYISSELDNALLQENFHKLIAEAEEKSFHICEECGKTGETRHDLPWISTLCDVHYIKRLASAEVRQQAYKEQQQAAQKALAQAQKEDAERYQRIFDEIMPLLPKTSKLVTIDLNDIEWVQEFDETDQAQLKQELHEAVLHGMTTNNYKKLKKLVKDWYITSVAIEDTLRRTVLLQKLSCDNDTM